jgi:hypothetical protein
VIDNPQGTDFGDLDVGFRLVRKPGYQGIESMKLDRITRQRFPEAKSQFSSDRVVLLKLKNRSPYISLHSIRELEELGIVGRTIYKKSPEDD